MEFRFIDDGTHMDIQEMNNPNAPTYYGVFVKVEKGVTFLISCDPLYDCFDELDLSKIYSFTFFRDANGFTFDAKITEKYQHFYSNTLRCNATSLVKSFNLRTAHRIRVLQMTANLYEKSDNKPNMLGNLIYTGPIYDVSRGGITLISNDKIKIQLHNIYMAEFVVNNETFRFPVEYLRGSERSLSPLYRYDYIFTYKGENLTENLNRLTLALFENQLKGGLGH
jgi:hypothetical protein